VVRESPADWLFNGILRPAWAYRPELALIALVAAAYLWLSEHLGRQGAERLIVAAAIVVAMVTWTREPLAHALFRSHLRRRWALACRHAELATANDRIRCMTLVGEGRTPELDTLLSIEQAAERLGTSPRFVRRLVFERRIAFVKVGRHVRITTADLDTYIATGRVAALRWEAG
jgi:excisionase family DNA binding protein